MALDHLGVIAARLRSSVIKFEKSGGRLKPLDEVCSISVRADWLASSYNIVGGVRHQFEKVSYLVRSTSRGFVSFVQESDK